MLAACASVPDAQERAARKAQAGLSADAARDSYRRGHDIPADPPNNRRDFPAPPLSDSEALSAAPPPPCKPLRLLAPRPGPSPATP
ncbi:hypothetical protein [Achromobacter ruhlandii]|uniref:hypothetical protein n=1 Tax=Achromobacter ruhlandii TaxID=72557 RepID=UPI001B8D4E87|nr:hypothetical protein [Achromobacter ruhlandii]